MMQKICTLKHGYMWDWDATPLVEILNFDLWHWLGGVHGMNSSIGFHNKDEWEYVLVPTRWVPLIPFTGSNLQSPGMKLPSLSSWSMYPGGQYE